MNVSLRLVLRHVAIFPINLTKTILHIMYVVAADVEIMSAL